MSGIGHNKGPSMEPGAGWRRHCWRKARRDLLPTLPLEIVRLRVARARQLGLDYKSYASFRAATGRDLVALLFSSQALQVTAARPALPQDRHAKLAAVIRCDRLALTSGALTPERLLAENPDTLDATAIAPTLFDRWPDIRARVQTLTAERGIPGDAVLLIGDTALDREWCAAGRLAGVLPSDRYFGTAS